MALFVKCRSESAKYVVYTSTDTCTLTFVLSLPRERLVFLKPKLFRLALPCWRSQAVDLPQPPIRLINVVLPVVALVCNVWFERSVDLGSRPLVGVVFVGKAYGDVLNHNANEGFLRQIATNPNFVAGQLDELDDDVESGQADGGVDLGNVFGKGALGLVICEGPRRVEEQPERHFG